MSWTYAPANAGSSDLSWIRMRVGDTTSGNQLLQDEEIVALSADAGDRYVAASRAAMAISGWFARRVEKGAGHLRLASQQASESYAKLSDRLLLEAGQHVAPWAGGISVSDKASRAADDDRVAPQFAVGMNDLPGTGVAGSTDTDLTGW